jgi:hypothetical protein
MLARLRNHDDITTDLQDQEMRRAMDGVRNNYPEAYRAMRPSANEVRRFLKNTGRQKPADQSLSDVPVIKIGQSEFLLAIKTFATKLFCALHYKHSGEIVPASGVIAGWFFSNIQVLDGKIPQQILSIVGNRPVLKRSNNDLSNQFGYEFTIAVEKTTSVFLCGFREAFAMVGMVSVVDDLPAVFDEDMDRGKFRCHPFRHGIAC